MSIRFSIFSKMIACVLIVVMCAAFMQEAQAGHCADLAEKATNAGDDLTIAILVLSAATATMAAACAQKTIDPRKAAICLGAIAAFAAAVYAVDRLGARYGRALKKFQDCAKTPHPSGSGSG